MVARTSKDSISSLLDEMRFLLIIAGVPEKQIRVRSNKSQVATLAKAFDWLHNFKLSSEFRNLIEVWALLPEATWRRYELFEIEGLREQELLKIAKKKVLRKWKHKRPNIFNRNRDVKKK